MGWWKRNAEAIEAAAATVTAIMAVAALVGIAWQVTAQRNIDREQAARDLYREHLSLTISARDIASLNYCSPMTAAQDTAYTAYVEHLVYTIEQTIALDPDLEPTMAPLLRPHHAYFCTTDDWSDYPDSVKALRAACPAIPLCAQ